MTETTPSKNANSLALEVFRRRMVQDKTVMAYDVTELAHYLDDVINRTPDIGNTKWQDVLVGNTQWPDVLVTDGLGVLKSLTTAKELADWITGLPKTSADYESKRKNLPDNVGVVDDLIGYFSEQITDPTKSSAPALLDALTGEKIEPSDGIFKDAMIDFAKQLKTELSTEEVTNLGSYFGVSAKSEADAAKADVIVDGLRVLKNLNAVKKADAGVKAKLETGYYTDNKGVVQWYSPNGDKHDQDVSAFLHDSALPSLLVAPANDQQDRDQWKGKGDYIWRRRTSMKETVWEEKPGEWVMNQAGAANNAALGAVDSGVHLVIFFSTTTTSKTTISWADPH
ncbi:hypothetical protein [Microcoleus sp.]|uniref:hypothetical protein n=1 Tax=Microcoleus sp. TaxID=44472 RepID=UPI003526A7B6